MVQNFLNFVGRTKSDESGSIAPIFAVIILALLVILGFAVDFRRISNSDSQLQTAVDSAVLASAQDYSRSVGLPDGQRLAAASAVFDSMLEADLQNGGYGMNVTSVALSLGGPSNEGITANVNATLPLTFGSLFGRSSVDIAANSGAEASPPRDVEIVLALDNTVSMFRNNRFNLMRSAAKDFTNTLLDTSSGPDAVSIGVVPWASVVNIKSERPEGFDISSAATRNVTAAGSREEPNAPFENRLKYLLAPEAEVNYTAAELAEDFGPVDWRGCIRTAPDERVVSGAGNVQSRLTDDPVFGMRWHVDLVEPHLQTVAFSGDTSNFSGDPAALAAGLSVVPNDIVQCDLSASGSFVNPYLNTDHACKPTSNSSTFDVLEACVSDANEHAYFNSGGQACPWRDDIFPWTQIRPLSGPNVNCPVAMLGLSQDRSQIIDKLDEMYPVGAGTHADIGLMWALRMLSPQREWADFFGQSRPSAYDDDGARKIMILLTDGENFYPRDIEGYYGCTATNNVRRESAGPCFVPDNIRSPDRDALDALMLDACEAIRDDYSVELFTIAVDITSTRTINLLSDCAGDPAKAFNISASEIDAVFETLAARELRLLE